jgi:ELWxxDGT repeat protein
LTNVNGILLFAASDGVHGSELWSSDGTAAGTVMIKDIRPGAESGIGGYSGNFANVSGALFFGANDGTHGNQLWVATQQQPSAATPPSPSPSPPVASLVSVQIKGDSAKATVTCTGGAGTTCVVTATLTVKETLKHGKLIAVAAALGPEDKPRKKAKKVTKTVVVGAETVSVPAGSETTVVAPLNQTGTTLLAARHKLSAKLTITSNGAVLSTRILTFTVAKKPKHRHGHG